MIDLDRLQKIMELMKQYGIEFVQAESEGEKIQLSKTQPIMASLNPAQAASAAHGGGGIVALKQNETPAAVVPVSQSGAFSAPVAEKRISDHQTVIKSPLIGTFYRAVSPTSPVFVDVGSKIKKGQTLCIVEAMKMMNQVESEHDGVIARILVENGKPVEYGTPLFVLE